MDTTTLLRVILARDAAAPPVERWDAAAWDAVHRAVIAWDAAPLAASSMRAAGLAKHVPARIFEGWRRDHTGTTAVNMRLAFEADALVKAIATRGGRAAKLKGTALFELGVYRDPGARPTSDIDLIVAAESAGAAREAIFARGYAQWQGGGPKHWPPFQRDGLLVEVHDHAFWSLADGHRVGLPEMIDVHGKPALAMVVAHLLHHLFESSVTLPWLVVKTLADLAEVRALVHARAHGAGRVRADIDALSRPAGALSSVLAPRRISGEVTMPRPPTRHTVRPRPFGPASRSQEEPVSQGVQSPSAPAAASPHRRIAVATGGLAGIVFFCLAAAASVGRRTRLEVGRIGWSAAAAPRRARHATPSDCAASAARRYAEAAPP